MIKTKRITKGRTDKEVEANWQGTWKEILEKSDGSIDKEQLKLELMDYSDMIHRMTELTCRLTGSLSYPTYPVDTIIAVMEEGREEQYQAQKADDCDDGVCSMCEREFDDKE